MRKGLVIGALLVVLTLSLGGSAVSKVTDNAATYEQLRLFTEVLSIVQNQYVDEVPPRELIYSGDMIDAETAPRCAAAGASMFVAGSAVFGAPDPAAAYEEIERSVNG